MASLVDAHVHLDDDAFGPDLDAVLARAATSGVRGFVVPGIRPGDFEAAVARAPAHAVVAVGLHPMVLSGAAASDDDQLARLAHALPRAAAVGEIGLDRLVATRGGADFARQQRVFAVALGHARAAGKTVVLHVVRAHPETRLALDTHLPGGRFVVHRFESSQADAESYLARGGVLSFGPAVTFPRAQRLREVLRAVPLDRLLLESDAPFVPLGPDARRGEPSAVRAVAETVAAEHGVSLEAVAETTTATAQRLFGLGLPTDERAHGAQPTGAR